MIVEPQIATTDEVVVHTMVVWAATLVKELKSLIPKAVQSILLGTMTMNVWVSSKIIVDS
jgi:hypothetical protein